MIDPEEQQQQRSIIESPASDNRKTPRCDVTLGNQGREMRFEMKWEANIIQVERKHAGNKSELLGSYRPSGHPLLVFLRALIESVSQLARELFSC